MLLERLEQRADRGVEAVAVPRQVGGSADGQPLRRSGGPTSPRPGSRRRRAARRSSSGPTQSRRAVEASAMISPVAARLTRERSRRAASSTSGVSSSTRRCSTRPVLRISTTSSRVVAERDQLDVAHGRAGQRGVLHDGDLAGQLREQPHRALHDVVEVDRAVEDRGDRALLRGAHRLERGEPVDEEPVALVGGHPAGAGVRLGDEPLLLQRRHVVADGGRARRRGRAARRGPWTRPAPRWPRSPPRWRGARRAGVPPASSSSSSRPSRSGTRRSHECQS